MRITNEWLKEHSACVEGYKWSQTHENRELGPFIKALLDADHWPWANWVVVRCMNKKQNVQYAVFAAEQVIEIFERKYPDDKRPRQAIEAARAYIDNPCAKTKAYASAAYAAASASAASAAYAAASAAYAAAYAAAADAYAAAVYAADAAASAYAAYAAKNTLRLKILNYGLELLKEGDHGKA